MQALVPFTERFSFPESQFTASTRSHAHPWHRCRYSTPSAPHRFVESKGIRCFCYENFELPGITIISVAQRTARRGRKGSTVSRSAVSFLILHFISEPLMQCASRWAVKEAAYKALYPIRPTWKEITYSPFNSAIRAKPTLIYRPLRDAVTPANTLHVSVSHDGDYIFAQVIAEST